MTPTGAAHLGLRARGSSDRTRRAGWASGEERNENGR